MLVEDLILQLMTLPPKTLVVVPRDAGFAALGDPMEGHFRPHNAAGGWYYAHERPDTIPCVALQAAN